MLKRTVKEEKVWAWTLYTKRASSSLLRPADCGNFSCRKFKETSKAGKIGPLEIFFFFFIHKLEHYKAFVIFSPAS